MLIFNRDLNSLNGSLVNNQLAKNSQAIQLNNGDLIRFGQDQQAYVFQYSEIEVRPPPSILDDKVSLVPKAYPTYARIDHLASPQILPQQKLPVILFINIVSREPKL